MHLLHVHNPVYCQQVVTTCSLVSPAIPTTSEQTTTQQAFVNNVTLCGEAFLHAFPGETGVLSSPVYPNNYPNSVACFWSITASDHNVVELTVVRLEMEKCRMCICDSLAIYDGVHTNSTLLHKLCKFLDKKIYSTGQTLRLEFVSDPIGTESGFQLNFTAVDLRNLSLSERKCDSSPVFLLASTSETSYIYSPMYPGNYSNNADCSWKISASDGYVIKMVVQNVDMERCSASCTCDKVQVFDASSYAYDRRMVQFCSSLSNNVLYTTRQYAFITFTSDTSITGKGFVITYRAVTYDTDYYRTTVSSPTFTEEHATNLVAIVVGCIIAAAAFIVIVVLVAVLISRRRKRVLNTYINLPRVGPSAAVPTLPPPAVYYYPHPSGATVPGEVFAPETLPSSTAFSNKAYAPDLIPTSNQPKEVADVPPSLCTEDTH